MSMQLFAAAIQPFINIMKGKYRYDIVAYADDIIIGHDKSISEKEVIANARKELAILGLKLSENKCQSNQDIISEGDITEEQDVEYLSMTFTKYGAKSLAPIVK